MAVSMLKRKLIRRIILARPAVEAGEKLGFLPGDLAAKVNPYLRPLFDALEDMMDFARCVNSWIWTSLRLIPLAFYAGSDLQSVRGDLRRGPEHLGHADAYGLDTSGPRSKMIITGDVTQTDLDSKQTSGLMDAVSTLKDIDGIGVVRLSGNDIVRHQLVQSIVQAYGGRSASRGAGQ